MKKVLAVALLMLAGSVQASTVLIDFEEFAYQSAYEGLDVSSKGYDFTIGGGICGGPGDTYSSVSSAGLYRENPSPEFALCGVQFTMQRADSGAFAVNSFDLTTGYNFTGPTYYGTLAGGGAANLGAPVGTGDWLNLNYFSIYVEGFGYSQLGVDDISVSAVPVPAAVWLFGSALGGLGWLRRKKNR